MQHLCACMYVYTYTCAVYACVFISLYIYVCVCVCAHTFHGTRHEVPANRPHVCSIVPKLKGVSWIKEPIAVCWNSGTMCFHMMFNFVPYVFIIGWKENLTQPGDYCFWHQIKGIPDSRVSLEPIQWSVAFPLYFRVLPSSCHTHLLHACHLYLHLDDFYGISWEFKSSSTMERNYMGYLFPSRFPIDFSHLVISVPRKRSPHPRSQNPRRLRAFLWMRSTLNGLCAKSSSASSPRHVPGPARDGLCFRGSPKRWTSELW